MYQSNVLGRYLQKLMKFSIFLPKIGGICVVSPPDNLIGFGRVIDCKFYWNTFSWSHSCEAITEYLNLETTFDLSFFSSTELVEKRIWQLLGLLLKTQISNSWSLCSILYISENVLNISFELL